MRNIMRQHVQQRGKRTGLTTKRYRMHLGTYNAQSIYFLKFNIIEYWLKNHNAL